VLGKKRSATVQPGDRGFLAAVLPKGKRAITSPLPVRRPPPAVEPVTKPPDPVPPPLNAQAFTNVVQGKAGEVMPGLFEVE